MLQEVKIFSNADTETPYNVKGLVLNKEDFSIWQKTERHRLHKNAS
jgi:hypothetical protein